MSLLDPNLSYEEISDELLLQEFNEPKKYRKMMLYALMAKRSNLNTDIRKCLFELILDESAQKEVVMGIIKHAWLPVISILLHGDDEVKLQLKEILKQWSLNEKELLLIYVRSDQEYVNLLHDII